MTSISTGLALVDEMLGGGLPRGNIVEMFGATSSGKTTVALNWVAAVQRAGLTPVWVDADRTLNLQWAAKAGVSVDELVVVRPDTGTQAAGIVDQLLRTFSVDLIVVDSAAALVEAEESLEDSPLEASNGFLARMLRRSRGLVERSGAVVIFINPQYQRDCSDVAGSTPGGRVLTQYSTIRIAVRSTSRRLIAGGLAGHELSLLSIKNKLAEPFVEARVDLDGAVLRVPARMPVKRAGVGPAQAARNVG